MSRHGIFTFQIIPTRCRNLHLKQFCLEDIVPAVLIILIAHIVLAIRWMLIKILSAVINHQGTHKGIVLGSLNVLYHIAASFSTWFYDFSISKSLTTAFKNEKQSGLHYLKIIPFRSERLTRTTATISTIASYTAKVSHTDAAPNSLGRIRITAAFTRILRRTLITVA